MTDTPPYHEIGVSRDGLVATHALWAAGVRRRQRVANLALLSGDGKDRRRHDPGRARGCGSAC